MPNINGRFADQDNIALTGIIQTANNNQTALNANLAETDQIRGSNVALQNTGLLANNTTVVPDVLNTVAGTTGAALGGVGQQGTPSTEPGGGGIPCFTAETLITLDKGSCPIKEVLTGIDMVKCHDNLGTRLSSLVIGKWEHWAQESLIVKFRDGRVTHTNAQHKYWVQDDIYEPIYNLDWVWHWQDRWIQVDIIEKILLQTPIMLYNLNVDIYHNYEANGDSVSNLKPIEGPDSGFDV